jgi:antibiotic biosynthesis monooxygenase (ABM) superfamily enzyme
MGYLLRFVQKFRPEATEQYLELEREFMKLEKEIPEFPKGKRFVPYAGRNSTNTLVWECEFDTLQEAENAIVFLENDHRHENLYKMQVPYFLEAYTEIYKLFE